MYKNWHEHVAQAVFAASIAAWAALVDKYVPMPYLDEFFHVPQAQKYCAGDYTWDPKITTPPGLYLVAKLFSPIFGCSTRALRLQNVFALSFIFYKVLQIRRLIEAGGQAHLENDVKQTDHEKSKKQREAGGNYQTPFSTALTAFNIASFPPLFFFGALYYTDVMSTAAVLINYQAFLEATMRPQRVIGDDIISVLTGVAALFFRQTNIFWVAVFPAGLTLITALKENAKQSDGAAKQDYWAVLKESWFNGTISDRALRNGGLVITDAMMLLLTAAVAALRSPVRALRSIISYVLLLVLFAGFVIWNGSVVLGDKSAHTATIHLPQMLYIWPYIALFSAPVLMGPLFYCVAHLLPHGTGAKTGAKDKRSHSAYVQPVQAGLFIIAALLAVHFNTIVHPYTLADNRHYVFYVFRLLLRHPALKYLAVSVYYTCFWLSIQSLTYSSVESDATSHTIQARDKGENLRKMNSPVQISFVVIWLITTALSVVTAPLVEPRYFIIPWIIWRLHVPHAPMTFSLRGKSYSADFRVVVETVWLLAMNQVLQSLFLYRTFTWPSEPGKVQRFLW